MQISACFSGKWRPDLSDIFVSHNTWTSYSDMLRIYKTYQFRFKSSEAETVSFPGYVCTV